MQLDKVELRNTQPCLNSLNTLYSKELHIS